MWPDAVASAMPRIKPSGPSSGSLQIPSSASSEVSELLDRDITPEDYEMPRTQLFELREAHAKALNALTAQAAAAGRSLGATCRERELEAHWRLLFLQPAVGELPL